MTYFYYSCQTLRLCFLKALLSVRILNKITFFLVNLIYFLNYTNLSSLFFYGTHTPTEFLGFQLHTKMLIYNYFVITLYGAIFAKYFCLSAFIPYQEMNLSAPRDFNLHFERNNIPSLENILTQKIFCVCVLIKTSGQFYSCIITFTYKLYIYSTKTEL